MSDGCDRSGGTPISFGDAVPVVDLSTLVQALLGTRFVGQMKPWHILIVQDRSTLDALRGQMPGVAPQEPPSFALVVCGDRQVKRQLGPLISDCYDATTSLLLACRMKRLRLRSTRVFPQRRRSRAVRELLGLPGTVVPYSVTWLAGRPDISSVGSASQAYVRRETWSDSEAPAG